MGRLPGMPVSADREYMMLDEYEKERREDILSGIRILSGEIIEEL